MTIFRNNIV